MKITITGARAEGKTRLVEALRGNLERFDPSRDVAIGDGKRPRLDASIQVYVTNDTEDAIKFLKLSQED